MPQDLDPTVSVDDASEHPERLGPYRILQILGEGGMGVVYEAEQTEPVRRRVALKVMKPGMQTRDVIARFESERQALAVMDHPGIAKVLDAGATGDGRPYFVMERVAGVPLTEYCDTSQLSVRQRLTLFVAVCQAVQHAHQKGVIHRDLKPSNVLVADVEGGPRPTIIDFGIAKAIGQRLTEKTLVTAYGQAIGTPAYMSPEQAEMSALDVDTRADVYSLGVMLYEVLVGRLPVDPADEGLHAFIAQLVLRETDPPTPSARFTKLGAERQTVARVRGTDPGTLRRQLVEDLDWIVMKAMHKDRNRRYATAHALVQDIERHLAGEPVLAGPPTVAYRMRKFLRRHRTGVAIAGVSALLVVAFGVVATVQAARIARERDRAKREAAKASAVTDFMQETLLAPDPLEGLGRDVTVREALDTAVARLGASPSQSPEIDAAIRDAIGVAYRKLGRYDDAEPLLESALATRERVLEPEHADIAVSVYHLADLRFERGDFAAAAALYARAVDLLRRAVGANDPLLAHTLKGLGLTRLQTGHPDSAETLFREALAIQERDGSDSLAIAELWVHLAVAATHQGRDEDAEVLWRRALELRRRHLGGDHPLIADALNGLANLLENRADYDAAEPLYREALAIAQRHFGEEHPGVAQMIGNLGLLLDRKGDDDEAQRLLERALALDRRHLGGEHVYVAVDLANLADFLCDNRNQPTSAGPAFEDAIRIFEKQVASDDFRLASTRSMYGGCLTKQQAYALAETQLLAAVGSLQRALGADHWRTRRARSRLAELYDAWGRPERASAQRALLEREQ